MTSTNELGAQVVFDGGVPRTYTFKARETISGGNLVVFSGAGNATVGSGLNTYATSDVEGCLIDARDQINGIALQTVTSGNYGTAATRGAYLVKCGGSAIEGQKIEAINENCVGVLTGSSTANGLEPNKIIGRPLTHNTSGTANYSLVAFDF